MSTVAFITRDMAGTTQHGNFSEGTPARIDAAHAKDISLNLSPADVESYSRQGGNLHITLADGQELVIENYYSYGSSGGKNLFLSQDGEFTEVVLEDKSSGMLFATYEPLDLTGKWSAYDEMVFLDVDRIEPVVAPLAAPLFGGLGAAGAAAGVVGAAVIAGGGGGDGGEGTGGIVPTVDNPDASYPVSDSTTEPVVITGTGAPGSDVTVNVGTSTATTTVDDDGNWSVSFPVDDLPEDGNYDTTVHVVDPNGTEFDLDGPAVVIDTVATVGLDEGQAGGDDMINAAEAADGVTLTGTAEAGATVEVTFQGVTRTVTATESGTWSADFAASEIASGEYDSEVSVTATDTFGNTDSVTGTIRVDTTTAVDIDNGQAGGDDIVSNAEATAGLTLTGTGEAGASVSVTVEGVTRTATVDADGNWAADFEAGSLPAGEYDTTVSVTSTDEAGNTATATADLHVDTVVDPLTLNSGSIEGDNIVNETERSDGVTLTGTVEPGSTVVVQLGDATETATVDADGNWSASFAAADIAEGSYDAAVVVSATDAVGNTSEITDTLAIDTEVVPFTSDSVTDDDVVSLAESAAGLSMSGTVEPGSAVQVTIQGVTRDALVDADGNWTAEFEPGDLREGTYEATAEITATDPAGNTQTLTEGFSVDTEYDAPNIGDVISTGTSVSGVFSDDFEAGDTIHELTSTGSVSDVSGTETDLGNGQTLYDFDADVPDGSHLVVNRVDDAGNSSGTMVVLEDGAGASVLDHSGLSQFNIDELNLVHADAVDLTLTEADINALSGNSDKLTVHGEADDTLTITGATAAGTETVDGETYNVYTIGDDGTTLSVDEDVNVVI
ncbi:Ig-like domain-containing protein [Leisingera sp. M658]|uniref:Ig-like domain-containing protein n=1 Tax=Leisingera sp. M658 TaxID=2867015 RepID=UPI0021A77362|nr:Ig-like domain-containing protein [Leisingera sp. M658]UWQ73985.1 Ig-like domain=containing protein [Leisingera sp. M658]